MLRPLAVAVLLATAAAAQPADPILGPRPAASSQPGTAAYLGVFAIQARPATGLSFGPDGELYVTEYSGTRRVNRFDGDTGDALGPFTPTVTGSFFQYDAEFGPDGDLYVAQTSASRVRKYDGATGADLGTLLTSAGYLYDLAFGPDGDLYVATFDGPRSNVRRYDRETGTLLSDFTARGSSRLPVAITFGPDGDLYVSDYSRDRIDQFDGTTGAFVRTLAELDYDPHGIAFGPDGHLYVVEASANRVLRYDGATGAFLDQYATIPTSDAAAVQLAFSPTTGDLLVSTRGGDVHAFRNFGEGEVTVAVDEVLAPRSGSRAFTVVGSVSNTRPRRVAVELVLAVVAPTGQTVVERSRYGAVGPASVYGPRGLFTFELPSAGGTGTYEGTVTVVESLSGEVLDEAAFSFGVRQSAALSPASALAAGKAGPNPFSDRTTLRYALAEAGPVDLRVFDAAGREVAVLASGARPAGAHAAVFEGGALPSGVYLWCLVAEGRVETGRLTLAR